MMLCLFVIVAFIARGIESIVIEQGECKPLAIQDSCKDFGELGGLQWSLSSDGTNNQVDAQLVGSPCGGMIDPLVQGDSRFQIRPSGMFQWIQTHANELCSRVVNPHFQTECKTDLTAYVCPLMPSGACEIKISMTGGNVHISGTSSGPIQYRIQSSVGIEASGNCLSCGGFSKTYVLESGQNDFKVWCNLQFDKKSTFISKSEYCANKGRLFFLGFDYKVCMGEFPYTLLLVAFFIGAFCCIFPCGHFFINFILKRIPKVDFRVGPYFISRLSLFVVLIIMVDMIVWAEATLVDHLKQQGFKPEEVEFKGLYRQTLPESQFEIVSTATGDVIKVDTFSVKVFPGFVSGFVIEGVEMDFKVAGTKLSLKHKGCYNTSNSEIVQKSTDTCSESCDKCLKALNASSAISPENIVAIPKTSSWNCDGFGCATIGTGCTCGYCTMKGTGHRVTVCEVVMHELFMNLCFNVGGKGLCKWLEHSEEFSDHIYQIKIDFVDKKFPEFIAESGGDYYLGDMNGLGELEPKFGDFQMEGSAVSFENDLLYRHECHFLSHRRITFTKCGQNHFYLFDNLKVCDNCKPGTLGTIMHDDDFGLANLKINLPLGGIRLKEDHVKLRSLKMNSCSGCRSCVKGFTCKLTYNSDSTGLVRIKCDRAQSREIFSVRRGSNTVSTTFFTDSKTGEIKCKSDDLSATAKFSLTEPTILLADSPSQLDTSTDEGYHCRFFSCTLGNFLYNAFGLKGLWHIVWMIAILLLSVFLLVLLVKLVIRKGSKYKARRFLAEKGYKEI